MRHVLLILSGLLIGAAVAVPHARAGEPLAHIGSEQSHGGVVEVGSPNVLVQGKPAARETDFASCPGFTFPVPHVGGPILTGSTTVQINGMAAARVTSLVGDQVTPSVITTGSTTVLIGP